MTYSFTALAWRVLWAQPCVVLKNPEDPEECSLGRGSSEWLLMLGHFLGAALLLGTLPWLGTPTEISQRQLLEWTFRTLMSSVQVPDGRCQRGGSTLRLTAACLP